MVYSVIQLALFQCRCQTLSQTLFLLSTAGDIQKISAFTEIRTLDDLTMFVKKLIRLARKSATASHYLYKIKLNVCERLLA